MTDYDALYQESLEQAKIKTQVEALKKSLNDDLDKLSETKPDELEQALNEVRGQIIEANNEVSDLQQQSAQVQC